MSQQIEFFFDIGSPYSYLAATQMAGVGERSGAQVRWRPFLLGGVFKAAGNTMPASVAAKARWMLEDLERWASDYGVDFRMASRFPLNTLKTQRALAAVASTAPESVEPFALALFRAYWAEDRDVSDEQVIRELADGLGLDGAAVVTATADPAVKELLKQWTAEAVERGAFGAPTIFVGDQMFWGNDRLGQVESSAGKG